MLPAESMDPPKPRRLRTETVERLRKRVLADRGRWLLTARAAGVSYTTLYRFAHSDTVRPWEQFLRRLDAYYAKLDSRS
jgi:hypothetical protein